MPLLEIPRELSRRIAPYTPALCHNDMLPANVLDDGQRVWIVYWAYGGIGHPLFNLAGSVPRFKLTTSSPAGTRSARRWAAPANRTSLYQMPAPPQPGGHASATTSAKRISEAGSGLGAAAGTSVLVTVYPHCTPPYKTS